eukprot:CAMPEP_0113728036 /NCGR_PEP_ID=MMETSP0038_2-20120614/41608_1 /TAXON_ID=2898 /ORGANISM="Cryptomonas paramecium" /LENGTH=41 /DNA_ID=CAMNT_0000659397 /DNA_START=67 /DNA_END=189 /DNA_ORIENTATION=- /assembly_acc=CAM_ASM_000170
MSMVSELSKRANADFRQDPDRQDHHSRGGELRHHRHGEEQD